MTSARRRRVITRVTGVIGYVVLHFSLTPFWPDSDILQVQHLTAVVHFFVFGGVLDSKLQDSRWSLALSHPTIPTFFDSIDATSSCFAQSSNYTLLLHNYIRFSQHVFPGTKQFPFFESFQE